MKRKITEFTIIPFSKMRLKPIGIKTKLIVFFLLLSIVPLTIVTAFSYIESKSIIKEKVGKFSEQLTNQTALNINSKIDEYERLCTLVTTNSDLLKIISKKEEDYRDMIVSFEDDRKVDDLVNTVAISSPDIKNVIFLSERIERYVGDEVPLTVGGTTYFNSKEFYESDVYKLVEENAGKILWITGLRGKYDKVWLMSMIKNASNLKANGIIIIGVDISSFDQIIESIELDKSARLVLLDTKSQVISMSRKSSDSNLIDIINKVNYYQNSGEIINSDTLITSCRLSNGWDLTSVVSVNSMMSEMSKVGFEVTCVGLICVIAAVIISVMISNSISRPINQIKVLMKKAEKGDLKIKINKGKNDEFGKLFDSFNSMISNIRKLVENSQDVSNNIRNNILTIKEISEQSASTSEEMSSAIQHIAGIIAEEASSAEIELEVISKLSEKIEKITDDVNSVKLVTCNAEDISNKAACQVNLLNDKTSQTAEMSNRIKDGIDELSNRISDINKLINIIKGINDQTKLLSLNAAIEAARAGEAGRGFSVVAEEIKKLSDQINEATKVITKNIQDIQDETVNTVQTVDMANDIFKKQEEAVHDVDLAFKNIITATKHISRKVELINTAFKEINTFRDKALSITKEIAESTKESACSTQQMMASSEEQAATSVELANLCNVLTININKLKSSIEVFKI